MSNSFLKTTWGETTIILINDPYALADWSKELKVSRSRLKEAIKAVGPMARDVKAWLARN